MDIPDDLAAQIAGQGRDLSRAALEALALDGYRAEWLSEAEVQQLLGLATRMEVHAFLKDRGAYLHYSVEDAERDRDTAMRARTRAEAVSEASKRRAG